MLLLFFLKSRTATLRSGIPAVLAGAVYGRFWPYLSAKVQKEFENDKEPGKNLGPAGKNLGRFWKNLAEILSKEKGRKGGGATLWRKDLAVSTIIATFACK